MTAAVEQAGGREPRVDAKLVKLGVVVMLGIIVSVIDGTVMVVALDTVRREFAASTGTVQWVTGAYLLATCVAIPASGYAVNRFSARTVWLAALATFLVASVLCGIAWSVSSLIGFRIVQGLSGGFIGMVATIVLTRAAGPERAGRAFSMVAVPSSLAPVLGPVAAGAVLDAASWRWLFYGQVPLLVAAFVAAARLLPHDAKDPSARLDWTGLLLLAPGLSALVFGLSTVADTGTSGADALTAPEVIGPIVAGLLLIAGFVVHALRRRATSIIDVRLFGNRNFNVAGGLLFIAGFLLYGLLFLIPLYYQQVVGLSATAAGALLAPQGLGMGIGATVVGSWSDRLGARPVVLGGLLLTAAGTLPFVFADAQPHDLLLAVALVVRGVGLTAVSIPLSATLYQAGLPQESIPHIATASAVSMRLGGAFGGAAAAVVLQVAATSVAGVGASSGASLPPEAFTVAFGAMTGLLVAPFLLALFLPGRRRAP